MHVIQTNAPYNYEFGQLTTAKKALGLLSYLPSLLGGFLSSGQRMSWGYLAIDVADPRVHILLVLGMEQIVAPVGQPTAFNIAHLLLLGKSPRIVCQKKPNFVKKSFSF